MKETALWVIIGVGAVILAAGGAIVTSNYPNYVIKFAEAIATAEGFYVAGSVPQRQNNPGDIMQNGFIATFATIQEGWAALYHQVSLMFNGTSLNYDPSMTIAQVGMIYSGGDPNWATNVAAFLGVSPDTTLSQLMT